MYLEQGEARRGVGIPDLLPIPLSTNRIQPEDHARLAVGLAVLLLQYY